MKTSLAFAMIAAATFVVAGCTTGGTSNGVRSPDPAHNARNSLDWAGVYRGILPCADCEGIETIVILQRDGTYRSQSRYLGKGDTVFSDKGRFAWNDAGDTVTFSGERPAKYFVGENRLIRLALDGSRVTGPLAKHYILTRLADGVTEKYWKLTELRGLPVPALEREPYLVLRVDGRRVSGFGGCNVFTGSYEIDEATGRIRFGQIAATMMACASGMEVEKAFHGVLRAADSYSLNGDRLTLNRARMAPLARFEAVYLR